MEDNPVLDKIASYQMYGKDKNVLDRLERYRADINLNKVEVFVSKIYDKQNKNFKDIKDTMIIEMKSKRQEIYEDCEKNYEDKENNIGILTYMFFFQNEERKEIALQVILFWDVGNACINRRKVQILDNFR